MIHFWDANYILQKLYHNLNQYGKVIVIWLFNMSQYYNNAVKMQNIRPSSFLKASNRSKWNYFSLKITIRNISFCLIMYMYWISTILCIPHSQSVWTVMITFIFVITPPTTIPSTSSAAFSTVWAWPFTTAPPFNYNQI